MALGMLCSTSEAPPPVDSIRCVPMAWVRLATTPPVKVWDDAGSSGTPGSIWIVNSLKLVVVNAGHDAPAGPFYELKSDRLSLQELTAVDDGFV